MMQRLEMNGRIYYAASLTFNDLFTKDCQLNIKDTLLS